MTTPTFSSDIEIIRDEVFTETGKMLESKIIPAEIMAAISGDSK